MTLLPSLLLLSSFLAPALISRPPVARRPVPRHPRRSALFYGSSHPVSTHSSYLDSISIARPDIRSRSRSRWTGYPPAVLLYSFVQDLQHEYDGVDCQKDYFKLPCAPFYDSIVDMLHHLLMIVYISNTTFLLLLIVTIDW